MKGAIIGDIVGSRFEFDSSFKSKDFELFHNDCKFTDDTAMTCAVADWILSPENVSELPAAMLNRYVMHGKDRSYGGGFEQWLNTWERGPYCSFGNGAAMRISPALLVSSVGVRPMLEAVEQITGVSHNHPEGMRGAMTTAGAILTGHLGGKPKDLLRFGRACGYDMSMTVDEIREDYSFDESCQGTVPQALICVAEAVDFEDAIRNAVSLGGDSDTLAAIAGSIAERFFGEPWELWLAARKYLPDSIWNVEKTFSKQIETMSAMRRLFSPSTISFDSVALREATLQEARLAIENAVLKYPALPLGSTSAAA